MGNLRETTRRAYYAPTAKRHFFTKRAAAFAEARAMLSRKYPPEIDHDSYGLEISYWHWSSDPHLVKVRARLARFLMRAA